MSQNPLSTSAISAVNRETSSEFRVQKVPALKQYGLSLIFNFLKIKFRGVYSSFCSFKLCFLTLLPCVHIVSLLTHFHQAKKRILGMIFLINFYKTGLILRVNFLIFITGNFFLIRFIFLNGQEVCTLSCKKKVDT